MIGDIIGVPGAPTLTSADVQRLMQQRDDARELCIKREQLLRRALRIPSDYFEEDCATREEIARHLEESC